MKTYGAGRKGFDMRKKKKVVGYLEMMANKQHLNLCVTLILVCSPLKAGQLLFSILKLGLLVVQVVPHLFQLL